MLVILNMLSIFSKVRVFLGENNCCKEVSSDLVNNMAKSKLKQLKLFNSFNRNLVAVSNFIVTDLKDFLRHSEQDYLVGDCYRYVVIDIFCLIHETLTGVDRKIGVHRVIMDFSDQQVVSVVNVNDFYVDYLDNW